MESPEQSEDTFNIMLLSVVIVVAILLVSLAILWLITKNAYLDAYFVLDAFFDAQNTAASSSLASLAFSLGVFKLSSIFAIVVIDNISRILITSFIFAAVIDYLRYANIEELINEARAKISRSHVVICGYNELSQQLMERLDKKGIKYVVVVRSLEKAKQLSSQHVLNLVLDFTDEQSLKKASIEKAQAVVFASESDSDNTLGALVARRLNPKIKIIARLKDERTRKKAYIAGVDMAVIPEYLAGLEMGDFIRRQMAYNK